MSEQPVLRTERLVLRPFRLSDAGVVQRLAGEREVAATTLRIPHPYEDGMAEAWIGSLAEAWPAREAVFAIVPRSGEVGSGEDLPVGSIGLELAAEHRRAEIGYWIGRPYWGRGLATEAAREIVRHGFEDLGLRRLTATCHAANEASSAVLRKIGMRREGLLRQHFEKWGERVDVETWGLLRSEWRSSVDRQGQ